MRARKNFWDRNAGLYDCFMRKDRIVYEKMYELICPVVKDKTVLELATGTGLIAKHIVKATAHIEATDASPEMITEAKRGNYSAKLHFSVQDMFSLPYAGNSFDVVTAFETVYFWPELAQNFREVYRVLKPGGVFFICNEANGETTKDDKWTQIIDGMTIYTDTALKEYLEKAGFCQIQSHKNKKGWLCVTAQKR